MCIMCRDSFVSRDKTLRLQSYFFFFLFVWTRCSKASASVFDFCAISKYMNHILLYKIRGTALKPLIVLLCGVFTCFAALFFFAPLAFKSLRHWILLNAFNVLLALVFRSFIKVILHRGPFFGFLFLWVDCVSTPTHSGIKEVFESI